LSAAWDRTPEALMRKKRETEKSMLNKTPLRVVPIGESPPVDDDQSATPMVMMPEHDAITRKMPEPPEGMPGRWRRFATWRMLVPAGALVFAISLVVVAMATRGKGGAPSIEGSPGGAVAPSAETAARPAPPPQPSVPSPVPAAAPPAPVKDVPETIHLEITAEPVEAELSVDGNVLAGHRLNIEVPKERGIHVISASAPGYLPFNQQVSFGSDVVLHISLGRGRTPLVRQPTRARSSPESRPRTNPAPAALGRPTPALEPGMNLEGPSVRPHAKPIDERNPYKP
jgi:hypothetical protein